MKNVLFAPEVAAGVVRCSLAIAAQTAALLLLLAAFSVFPAPAQSQAVVIDCLPPDSIGNNRFLSYLPHAIKHPSLSLNGFDCESSGTNCNRGYGLKQVLEEVYSPDADPTMKSIFQKMIRKSNESLVSSSSLGDISSNTIRLQSRGFVALAAYVLENNDYDPTALDPALPSASAAVNSFRTALLNTTSWKINTDNDQDDGVHWATPVTSVARAMDFYLALENAYKHYDPTEYANVNSTSILSWTEKTNLKNQYTILINKLEELRNIISNRYNTEPGNAPLAMQVAIGYATLVWQQELLPSDFASWFTTRSNMNRFMGRAFKAAGEEAGTDRHKYWRYQSDDGKHFWAEGPYYFHTTLDKVIPFWHAARINSLLSRIDDRHERSGGAVIHSYGFNDPFREGWLLRPLHWLADLSTPDGKTPPIDDGNKSNMYNMGILRWSSAYGEASVGQKFAWVDKMNSSSYRSNHLYPVEIAIPHASVPSSNPLDEVLGNTFANRKSGDGGSNNAPASDYARQEVVIRRKIGERNHYILLNGESGDAIARGEGHEQGDQMQLLYYVDDTSYLVDSGYDSVDRLRNSTWNHYNDHNVMWIGPRGSEGGVWPPFFKILDGKDRKQSTHQNMNSIYRKTYNKVDVISAHITLHAYDEIGILNIPAADYFRTVLFITDENHPYLIDINGINTHNYGLSSALPSYEYFMNYHVNSDSTIVLQKNGEKIFLWKHMYISENNSDPQKIHNDLFIQPFPVNRAIQDSIRTATIREAYLNRDRGIGVDINLLELSTEDSPFDDYSTVAFIRALSSGEATPDFVRANRVTSSFHPNFDWQYFTWVHSSTVIDVFVVRSSYFFDDTISSVFDRTAVITEADSFYVYLPRDKNYGFARLVKQADDTWSIDSNYHINLVAGLPPPPLLSVSASGPDCIDSGNSTGHFVASPSGGKPPYSYSWSSYRICDRATGNTPAGPQCNAWNNAGATRTIDYGGYNGDNFKIRVQVTDNSSPRQSVVSSEWEVSVLSSTEGSCPSDSNSKESSDTEETLASNADLLEAEQNIPETYALRQNFPNPFNPSTEIQFDLPEDALVSLVVYDVLGREVARLVQDELHAGAHRARFDVRNLPSGVYFYRIQAGDFTQTRRMTLLK